MLEASGIHVSYGPLPAVRGVDLNIEAGEAVAILGRNGAGKTTTLKALAGLLSVNKGTIRFDGKDITSMPAERRARIGLALVPEGRGMFPDLSVRDSLAMGAYSRRLPASRIREEIERVTERFPRLTERMTQRSGSLSGGEQQMLAVARGLMSDPKVLLVDEPSLGLAPIIVEQLYELFASLRQDGLTIFVVEQYVELALGFADRAYVLDKGQVVLADDAATLLASSDLVEAYMSAAPEVSPV